MKPLRKEQEIIVLGSGLGGLIAGAVLSKNNRSVLLLKEKGYQSECMIRGYRFEPFSNFSEKFIGADLLREISLSLNLPLGRALGTGKQTKTNLNKPTPSARLQVILPKTRIDIIPDRVLFLKEWKREFPREIDQIESFYSELDQVQHLSQKENRKNGFESYFPLRNRSFLTRIFSFGPYPKEKMNEKLRLFSREFKAFIQLQLVFWGNLHSDQFPVSHAAHILSDEAYRSNTNVDLGGLEKEVLSEFLRHGGRVLEIDRVEKIDGNWRKGITLTLEGEPGAFDSRFLILNSPLHRISSVLNRKARKLSRRQSKLKAPYIMIPLFLGISEKAVPVGMKDFLISIHDLEKSYDDGNVLFLSLSARGDESRAPQGKRALTVESLMKTEKYEHTFLIDHQKKVMGHLSRLFPFLENEMEWVDFDWAGHHIPRWSYPHFFYEVASDFRPGQQVIPTRLTKTMYFTGKESFPSWGIAGEVFSGLTVARKILKAPAVKWADYL